MILLAPPDDLPTEPGIFTDAERLAHREQDALARIDRIETRELSAHDGPHPDLLWLAQGYREAIKQVITQRTMLALHEQGQGILGDNLRHTTP